MQRYSYLLDVTTMHCAFNKTNNVSLQSLLLKIYNDISEAMTLYKNSFLTLKMPVTTAADNIYKYFIHCFSEKIRLDVSRESSARQRIHMK